MARETRQPIIEDLQRQIENFQAEATHFIVVKQELIDTQALLERERNRFRDIQACSEQLLQVDDLQDFTTILLESILETFEFEVSLFTRYDAEGKCLQVIGKAGFATAPISLPFDFDSFHGNTGVILSKGDELLSKWASAGLREAIICPYFSENDPTFTGMVIGGLTLANPDYFEPINPEIVSSFSVMVTQAGSLLRNYELKKRLQEQNVQLEDYSKNLESIVEERTKDLRQANKELDLLYQQSIVHLRVTREELSYQELLAQTDALTGLNNRRYLDTQLEKFIEVSLAGNERLGLLMFDLDNFKLINDTHGHPRGDLLLKAVAETLKKSCRNTDLLCRLGGDEFGVIMPGISVTRGREVAELIRSRIEALPPVAPDCQVNVTASLGGGLYLPPESPSEFISRVDEYLYQAKRQGRNRVIWKE